MGTLIAVRKGSEICLGVDCLNLRDATIRAPHHSVNSCVIRYGESFIGLHASVSFQQAFESIIRNSELKEPVALHSRGETFDFFGRVHELLRSTRYMFVSFQQGQEFEWMPMSAVVVNRSGIYRIDSARAVYEHPRYVAIGSSDGIALGALYSSYDRTESAAGLIQHAFDATREFEGVVTTNPTFYSIKSPLLLVSSKPSSLRKLKKRKTPSSTTA